MIFTKKVHFMRIILQIIRPLVLTALMLVSFVAVALAQEAFIPTLA